MATGKPTENEIKPAPSGIQFVNGMQLSARHWLAVAVIVVLVLSATPWAWKKIERFETGPDYRIPYALSEDYWIYERWLDQAPTTAVPVIGDSVVWGEYTRRDGALPHFLNEKSGQPGTFMNAGVNGMFPLALEGLIRQYGGSLSDRKVILHCNVLWMSSPRADLSTEKETPFNHPGLVPQFYPRIPCYRSDFNNRLGAVVKRNFTFSQWADHLQIAYFDHKNILAWTLEEDGADPNAFKNPFAQITLATPAEPDVDPERGPSSPRHKPWSTTGAGSTQFEWLSTDASLQWAAFQRLVRLLQARGNDVLVVVGPFNEHVMAEEGRPGFRDLRDGIATWLEQNNVSHVIPDMLPSPLYADASHPLTEGYKVLAAQLYQDPVFLEWIETPPAK